MDQADKKTSGKIINYISSHGQASGKELADFLNLTTRAVRKQLSKLFAENKVSKIGKSPKVFYVIKKESKESKEEKVDNVSAELKKVIDENYLIITPKGERKGGFLGFSYWCERHNLPLEKTALEYAETLKKYEPYKKDGLIDGGYKMTHTFKEVYLDQVFYLDFYSIERFGKTKLGQLLLYAKQSQSLNLIRELVAQIRTPIEELITKFSIQAVGFIPPTVKREVQLMRELEGKLNLTLPKLSLVKVKTEIAVAQKTLTKLEDRIENARGTIVADEKRHYDTVLLIDDALGSGATLNETAKKIKERGVAKKAIGLAITGSFSGFEIISEV
ncbi:MAG: HTH domain-containing protein [Patescibacteria group bacterium]